MSQTEMGNMSGMEQESALGQPTIEVEIDAPDFDAPFEAFSFDESSFDLTDDLAQGELGVEAVAEPSDSRMPTDVSDLTIDIIPIESSAFDPAAIAAANRQARAAAPATVDTQLLADLQAQNQKLLTQNDEILGWVSELERALDDAQAALLLQDEQAQRQENQLVARNDELLQAQERSQRLVQEMENAQKLAQRQQILIETLTAQLETAQERLAQMERECTLAQVHSHEQTQKLAQGEGTIRNLKSRLQRQQRYTLQFRAALEKCLEASVPQPIEDLTLGSPRIEPMEPIETLGDLLPKSRPVQPWSSRFELNMSDIEAIQREIKAVEDAETLGLTYDLGEEAEEFPPMALREANAELDDILRQTADRIPSFDPDSDWAGAAELSQELDEPPTPELAAGLAAGLATIGMGSATLEPKVAPIRSSERTPEPLPVAAQPPAKPADAVVSDLGDVTAGIAPFDPAFNVFDAIAARLDSMPAAPSQASPAPVTEPTLAQPTSVEASPVSPDPAPSQAPIRLDEVATTDEQFILDQILSRMTNADPQRPGRSPSIVPPLRPPVPAMANAIPDDVAAALGIQADWPAPVVHPLRQKKKIGSMASIDLPSFPKP